MKIKYFADDGTGFDSMDGCALYEAQKQFDTEGIKLYDEQGNLIDIDFSDEDLSHALDDVVYVKLENYGLIEALKNIEELYYVNLGSDSVATDCTSIAYDSDIDEWVSLDEKHNDTKKYLELIEKVVNN